MDDEADKRKRKKETALDFGWDSAKAERKPSRYKCSMATGKGGGEGCTAWVTSRQNGPISI